MNLINIGERGQIVIPQQMRKEMNIEKDAKYFEDKGDIVSAFAALNYAHGWLDAGARIGVFIVKDSRLFTV